MSTRIFSRKAMSLGRKSMLLFVIVRGALGVEVSRAADVTSIWNNSTGDWTDAARWSSIDFPNNGNGGQTYDAIINSGNVLLDQDISIDHLTLGGAINGGFDLSLATGLDWTGGSLSGTGIVTAAGGTFSTGQNKFLNRTLRLTGDSVWDGGQLTFSGNQGTLEVAMGNTLRVGGTSNRTIGVHLQIEPEARLINDNSGLTTLGQFGATLTNNGVVETNAGGPLAIVGNQTTAGEFRINDNGTLRFPSGTQTYAGDFTGNGTAEFTGATVELAGSYTVANTQVSSGTVNFNTGATVDLGDQTFTGGTIGGSDDLNLSSLAWTGGGLRGSGVITAAGGSISGALSKFLEQTLRMTGDFVWNGGQLTFSGNQGAIQVATGNTFYVDGSSNLAMGVDLQIEPGASLVNNNLGTTTLGQFSGAVTNQGIIETNAGTLLALLGNQSSAGEFRINEGGTIRFAAGTQTYTGDFMGNGTAEFSGATVDMMGSYNVTHTRVSSGRIDLNTGSTVDLGDQILSNGTIGGGDDLILTSLEWSGGSFRGTGVVTSAGGTITGGLNKVLDQTMRFTQDVTWSGGQISFSGNQGTIEVATGRNFTVSGSSNLSLGVNLLLEPDAYLVSNNTGITTLGQFGASVTNNGVIEINNGSTVSLISNQITTGEFRVQDGGTLRFGSGTQVHSGGLTGNGTAEFAGATVDITGSYSIPWSCSLARTL